ncbi:uncharacterized protein LOC129959328 [Argiope bruennichi]|uniref:Gag-Pol polyprotein like n=1 Tax=Argiope bruennichi TaxID=94029 RepID=A0A8T0F3U8_ARGBR|nr:uncharacterized protein LOC129959328 [Argiope bruennichi]KAF8785521.1 Gag-Pol polyprotein like [Argiope bruennichi]
MISTWISHFGIPQRITSDQEGQFERKLFSSLSKYFGFPKSIRARYHPQSNRLIERQHRIIKANLKRHLQLSKSWVEALPLVLLGLRSALKEDIGYSSAELLYGSPLCLPREFVTTIPNFTHSEFVQRLQIRSMKPSATTTHDNTSIFVSKHLLNSSHVFVYNNATTLSLQAVYLGPYAVKHRAAKYFDIEINGTVKRISIDRLKPCFTIKDNNEQPPETYRHMDYPDRHTQCEPREKISTPVKHNHTTRSGRTVKFPLHLKDYVSELFSLGRECVASSMFSSSSYF